MHQGDRRLCLAGAMLVTMACSPFVVSGCEGGSDGAASPGAIVPVDSRFASAEAILQQYNALATSGPRVSHDALVSLMYAENPLQERFLRIFRSAGPFMELDQACWDSFGAGLFAGESTEGPLVPYRQKATMTEAGPDRARATQVTNDGDTEEIYLVRIGDRWWLSCFTIEYDPEFNADEIDLDKLERALRYLAASSPAVADEVRRGTWRDAGPQRGPQFVLIRLAAQLHQDHGLSGDQIADLMDWTR